MNLLLGVCGSVAAYRAADLARELMRNDHTVRVCLTDAAAQFVSADLFQALTGQPVLRGVFEEPIPGRMAHIDWARQAEAILVAPASASTINKLAAGIGDDMLTTIALASTAPLILAPAMNPQMYQHPATQSSLRTLRERGAFVVEPTEGDVACGEHGQGKLASNAAIVAEVLAVGRRSQRLRGKRVLITTGPTCEPIDGVRFLSNRSSGKMGAALAQAALAMGAKEVVVISGPTSTPLPLAARVIPVQTAEEMLAAGLAVAGEQDLIIGAAAVADYRPASPVAGKLRRKAETMILELSPNPDVIARLAAAAPSAAVIGFAAEPDADLSESVQKIRRKGLRAIAVNDISRPDIGFESDWNELTLIDGEGSTLQSGLLSKLACAFWLLEQVA